MARHHSYTGRPATSLAKFDQHFFVNLAETLLEHRDKKRLGNKVVSRHALDEFCGYCGKLEDRSAFVSVTPTKCAAWKYGHTGSIFRAVHGRRSA